MGVMHGFQVPEIFIRIHKLKDVYTIRVAGQIAQKQSLVQGGKLGGIRIFKEQRIPEGSSIQKLFVLVLNQLYDIFCDGIYVGTAGDGKNRDGELVCQIT
jgi:hypothetical protein